MTACVHKRRVGSRINRGTWASTAARKAVERRRREVAEQERRTAERVRAARRGSGAKRGRKERKLKAATEAAARAANRDVKVQLSKLRMKSLMMGC